MILLVFSALLPPSFFLFYFILSADQFISLKCCSSSQMNQKKSSFYFNLCLCRMTIRNLIAMKIKEKRQREKTNAKLSKLRIFIQLLYFCFFGLKKIENFRLKLIKNLNFFLLSTRWCWEKTFVYICELLNGCL